MTMQTESRKALRELIDLLSEVDERWASPEWRLSSEADVIGAHRALMHILEGGLGGVFESDPSRPDFRRIVSPSRKFTGDNPDAIYYDAPISGDREYIVRGNMDGAIYIVWRYRRHDPNDSRPNTTARAVFGSTLTDAAAFSALGVAVYPGLVSVASVALVALGSALFANLVWLPAALEWKGEVGS